MKTTVFRALVIGALSLGAVTAYAVECHSGYIFASGRGCVPEGEGESLRVTPAGVPSPGRTIPQQRSLESKKAQIAPSAASPWIGNLWSRLFSRLGF